MVLMSRSMRRGARRRVTARGAAKLPGPDGRGSPGRVDGRGPTGRLTQEGADRVDGALYRLPPRDVRPSPSPVRNSTAQSSMQAPSQRRRHQRRSLGRVRPPRCGMRPPSRRCRTNSGRPRRRRARVRLIDEARPVGHQAGGLRQIRDSSPIRDGVVARGRLHLLATSRMPYATSSSGVGFLLQNHLSLGSLRRHGAPSCRFRTMARRPGLRWIRV